MIDVLSAIQVHFDNNAALASRFPNGAYLASAPDDDTTFPRCVLTLISNVPDYSTVDGFGDRNYLETASFQFSVFADTDTMALTALKEITDAFDFTTLPTIEDYFIACRRTSGTNIMREDQRIWHGFVEYQVIVERSTVDEYIP